MGVRYGGKVGTLTQEPRGKCQAPGLELGSQHHPGEPGLGLRAGTQLQWPSPGGPHGRAPSSLPT